MFNDSDSFFYSPTGDLTNTLQRQFSGKYDAADPLWKRVRNFSINFVIVQKCIIIHTPECSIHVFLRTVGTLHSSYCYTECTRKLFNFDKSIPSISDFLGDLFFWFSQSCSFQFHGRQLST